MREEGSESYYSYYSSVEQSKSGATSQSKSGAASNQNETQAYNTITSNQNISDVNDLKGDI